MDLDLLRKAIMKRKTGSKLMVHDDEPEEMEIVIKKAAPKEEEPEKEDGLSPEAEGEEDEGLMAQSAEAVLGRKPMSTTQNHDEQSEAEEYAFDSGKEGGHVADELRDEELIRQLKSGRKPKSLAERMQLHISKK